MKSSRQTRGNFCLPSSRLCIGSFLPRSCLGLEQLKCIGIGIGSASCYFWLALGSTGLEVSTSILLLRSTRVTVRRRSRRTFSTHFEIFRRRFDGVVIYFFNSDFKFFDASEFSVTSFCVIFIFS